MRSRKSLIQKISGIKEDIETLKNKLTIYQGEGNYVEASKIMYVLLPNLQKQLKEAETKIASQR